MSKSPRPADIYFRFLRLSQAMRDLPSLAPLDALEERILSFIVTRQEAGHTLGVRELMSFEELGSPATVHGRLTSMRKKGWLLLADTDDARRKSVELTQAALAHFDRLSRCLTEAVTPPSR
ncbi:winged helix-turn-helix domain-containing protein [Massilia arenosa]|uniref:Winged helix-turn-helix domain-containing protein n=1 Tax=Zemynaea arenosa TaxID=2561931 RepID=A0A4Y9SE55_9BURK|nr:winged helix-turn-helix domain-containing protein [Massilia arenosa]TFW20830.1 winged helix-turn-helix domain-containing protein [Massilia arenosa]